MINPYPPLITPVQPVTPVPTMIQAPPLTMAPPLQLPPPPPSPWKTKFPSTVSAIFSAVQGVMAIGIIGCEIASILIDQYNATIYVGLWAGLFIMTAWISQEASGKFVLLSKFQRKSEIFISMHSRTICLFYFSACCCRERGCATFTLTMQIVALIFAACVIGFDAYFITNTSACFFSSNLCNGVGSSRGIFYSTWTFNNVKMSVIRAQLAAACVSFVLSIAYIIMYIVTAVLVQRANNAPSAVQQLLYSVPTLPTGPDGMILAPPPANIRTNRAGSPLYHRPAIVVDYGDGRANDLTCPTCSTTMAVSVRRKPIQ